MSETTTSSNKRIARNTIMLYIRMLLSIVVSLYTSRVVLTVLGVEDYGIYGVVGGVVSMFTFLNASMSGATSRFLTYEMGTGNMEKLKDTFSSALLVHIIIALLIFILAETVGLWFLIHKLVVPEDRMFAAHIVYQLSILSAMVSITQVPYNATIIAHEKMDVYAYVELLNVFLKLAIVFLLPILGNDKLIVYAILVFFVSVLIVFIYRYYCIKHYTESRFQFVYKKEIIKPMLSFSGWDLYGNMAVGWRYQGMAFLLNMFFGPVLNAASSISTTVQSIILGLCDNVSMAFRPQIIKCYAGYQYNRMNELLALSVKFTLSMFLLVSIPAFIEIDYVLSLWLGQIPEYSPIFFRIIIIANIWAVVNRILNIPIHATGRIKQLSFITGSLFLLSLVPMYIGLKFNFPPTSIYFWMAVFNFLILVTNFIILKHTLRQVRISPMIKELTTSLVITLLVYTLVVSVRDYIDKPFLRLLSSIFLSILSYGFLFISFQMKKTERLALYHKVFKR